MGPRAHRTSPAPRRAAPPVARRLAGAGVLVVVTTGAALVPVTAAPRTGAASPSWDTSCAGYPDQAFAQRIHDLAPAELSALDADGDGVACEELPLSLAELVPDSTTPATDGVACSTFPSREVAQSTADDLRARGDDALARALDEDGDGAVCEDHPDDGEGAAA